MLEQMPGKICSRNEPSPGISKMAETTALIIKIKAYAKRVDVEFFIDGKHLQHKLHAAEPQQHVILLNSDPIAQPIFF